ncbi:MAG: hypothetical protein OH338_04545 [Candidatus Parvarchaeota archaeon]|nr:hypothetical protein [Candidatus Parvarchaeum tengchongense]MDZ7355951.1 hypothetical protein [candidate division KSB1 bacterium]
MRSISEIKAEFEVVNQEPSSTKKDKKLSKLMTELERDYKIPMLRDKDFEDQNKELIEIYKKISFAREV